LRENRLHVAGGLIHYLISARRPGT
jgi:hypothetical protein